jgi:carbonic anhydrase
MAGIRVKSSLLKELETKGSIKIVGAMYNLATAGVEFFA